MKILLIEDGKSTQLLIKTRLEREGHEVDSVDNGHQGFQMATSNRYDVVLSDIRMPHWDGFKFIEAIQVISPQLPIIIVTSASGDEEIQGRLHTFKNVLTILPKPFDFAHLFELLANIQSQSHVGVNKRARIVCTIGPASDNVDTLGKMVIAGMDVCRLNFSHGTYEQHEKTLTAIRQAERNWSKPLAVLQDLCGPKIRTGKMEGDQILLTAGESIRIVKEELLGTSKRFSTIAPEIIDDLNPGDPILLDDGLLELKVEKHLDDGVRCEIINGGLLKSGKGINLPETKLSLPSVTEKDWRDLDWGLSREVDYVALSFVRSADEIREIKDYIASKGNNSLKVVAKIEKPEAVKHIKDIIEISDGIMIARGDMGVELPAARVPRIQQEIIRLCWKMNTPVITATQMLDSMTTNARPTRAEVTDVSTAIGEGTDAVMLSQETATGVDPVNVVRTMASIICEEEHYSSLEPEKVKELLMEDSDNPVIKAVASFSSTTATLLLDAGGHLYPLLSKWSRIVPSILVTQSIQAARHASLYKNITPIIIEEELPRDETLVRAMEIGIEIGALKKGELIAAVEGERITEGGLGQTGALQLLTVP